MRAGDLKDRIVLEESTGQTMAEWIPRESSPALWAAVEWLGADGTARIRVRYRHDLKSKRDIGAGLRVLFEGHVLTVDDITEVVRHQEVHLQVHDQIADMPNLATGATGVAGA